MTYGAPTNLDLSACTLSTDGGKTFQTLAELSGDVGQNTAALVTVNQNVSALSTTVQTAAADVSTAKVTAATAMTSASSASAAASTAQTTANAAIPKVLLQAPGGVPQYSSSGNTLFVNPNNNNGTAQIALGSPSKTNLCILKAFCGTTSSTDADNATGVVFLFQGGTGTNDGTVSFKGKAFVPGMDNTIPLGSASDRFSQIFAGTGAIQTSDVNMKTVVGVLGDGIYADSEKLIKAGQAIRKAISVFTFRDGGSRQHVGAIAQQVYAALSAEGLDPAAFGIWGQDALTQQVEVRDGKGVLTDIETKPVLDNKGQQVYRQSLRYDELSMLLIAAGEAEMQALTARVMALEVKAGA